MNSTNEAQNSQMDTFELQDMYPTLIPSSLVTENVHGRISEKIWQTSSCKDTAARVGSGKPSSTNGAPTTTTSR